MPIGDVLNHAHTRMRGYVIRVVDSAKERLYDSVLLPFATAGLGLAGIWLAADYAGVSGIIFAPPYALEALVRDVAQGDGNECTRPHGRRCASNQAGEPAPLYAPFERAARKVLRHAGVQALVIDDAAARRQTASGGRTGNRREIK